MDITEHKSSQIAKILAAGDSGVGKTGSLISLIEAGYKIRMIDTDRGVDILANLIRYKNIKTVPGQVQVITVEDEPVKSPLGGFAGDGKGFHRAIKAMEKWEDGTLPPSWGPDTVFVIDSWSSLSGLSMTNTMRISGKPPGTKPEIQHWGSAVDDLRSLLNTIMSDYFKCQVIVFTHITYVGTTTNAKTGEEQITKTSVETGDMTMYPNALGSKLPTEMGRHFNNLLGYRIMGQGPTAKRQIETLPFATLGVKTSSPFTVKRTYPIETGLLDFFKDLGITLQNRK